MRIKCLTCGERVSMGWLILGMPWSRYTCNQCGSVFAGTFPRLLMVSVSTGILGYALIAAIKSKIDPQWLPLPLVLTLAVLFLDLPMQIKRVELPGEDDDAGPEEDTEASPERGH